MFTPAHLAIIVPCYNEEAMLPHTLTTLTTYLDDLKQKHLITENSFLYLVDDGSNDMTWTRIQAAHQINPHIKGLKLSRNFGHQNALLAGMLSLKNKVDCAITIDADLQDDETIMEEMIAEYQKGRDIVCGVRRNRQKDTFFKRHTAAIFYKIMKSANKHIIDNHADFRLLSQRALKKLAHFKEVNVFLRGIFPIMGYSSSVIYYDRKERQHGETKYPLSKMIALAWDAITSFSHKPLDFILILGVTSFILSIAMIAWVIIAKITAHLVPGWASIMIPLCFMGGVQLLSIGIIGEYIAKIYLEVKRRPRYIADEELF